MSASLQTPPFAHVPGENARHAEGAFDHIRASVTPEMDEGALAASAAFRHGLHWLERGYFWEAHEVLEPVWMACPDGDARALTQGLIQLANARLKRRMARPRAAARLYEMALGHLGEVRERMVLGIEVAALMRQVESEAEIRHAI